MKHRSAALPALLRRAPRPSFMIGLCSASELDDESVIDSGAM
jgi:hypothetical protein